MTQFDRFVGVDVGRDHLDIHCHPDGAFWRVTNSAAGIRQLLRRLGTAPGRGAWVVACEATGGYENRLLLALSQAGRPGYCLHPRDVRAFARLKGRLAKNDRLDAQTIAEALPLAVTARKPAIRTKTRSTLKELTTLRRSLIAHLNTLKSLRTRMDSAEAGAHLDPLIDRQKAAIKRLGRDIQNLIAKDSETAAIARRLMSAPGAGPGLAAEIIAAMPELGQITGRQAASLTGVAPHPRQSGTSSRPGRCQGGRGTVRRLLYMAALSIVRAGSAPLHRFYQRLRAAGKPFKVAIVAVMRKLIITLNAMLKHNTDWTPNVAYA